MTLFDQLHSSWRLELVGLRRNFDLIESKLTGLAITPEFTNILRALALPIDDVRVVIVGQDPYPGVGFAHGLAFSVDNGVSPLPASLRNIFQELDDDFGPSNHANGDLHGWAEQGVLLLNRILTTEIGESLAHKDIGWQEITDQVARIIGARSVVAILWGKSAQELSQYFQSDLIIASPHPSPLSAHRGFFGSKPFTRSNQLLTSLGHNPIDW